MLSAVRAKPPTADVNLNFVCLRGRLSQSATIPAFLRAHAYSHYALRPYPPRFDAAKPLYALADADDAPAMMWASFARMCCRSGVERKDEMVGAVQEFLSRWLRASTSSLSLSLSSSGHSSLQLPPSPAGRLSS